MGRLDKTTGTGIHAAAAQEGRFLKMKKFIVEVFNLCRANNGFLVCVVLVLFAGGWFFIDAFIPNVTEINGGETSLTKEDSAQFYVPSSLTVKSMDGRSVTWTRRLTAKAIAVLLPAGAHTFTLDYKESTGTINYSAKDLKISADFAPGKYYRFNHTLDMATSKISYSIQEGEPVMFKTGFDPPLLPLPVMVIAFVIAVIIYRKKKAWRLIPGNVVTTTAKPHPEIVLNHVPGKPKHFITMEEKLKSFECVTCEMNVGTFTQDDLKDTFHLVAKDLGLQGIKTSDITEAQYGKPIKTFVLSVLSSANPNDAILYSFVWKGKKMIGHWLRNQYLYTLE
jgi:hypothetical protein